MSKVELHRRALALRKQNKSYSQIKQELGVSKSTLSLWLRNYPLSKEQILLLRGRSEVRIEKYRQTMQRKREKRLQSYYEEERNKWLPFTFRELFLSGLFLYWGEGNKSQRGVVSINNTDPLVMKFAVYWLVKCLKIPKEKIRVFIHLYSDMDISESLNYWSNQLHLPRSQFTRPYIKENKKTDLDQKGFGYGTCGIRCNNTVIKERILMAIQAVADYYREKSTNL